MKAIPTPQSYKSLLLQGNWFSHIPSELADALLAVADVVSFSAGQSVFLYGDPKQGLYGVVSGVISIDRQREDGKEALLALVEAPNWFGEITLFDRQQRTHNARAITDSILVHISGDALNALLAAQPQYWQYLGLLLTSKVRLLMDIAEDLALRSTAQRVAKRLAISLLIVRLPAKMSDMRPCGAQSCKSYCFNSCCSIRKRNTSLGSASGMTMCSSS